MAQVVKLYKRGTDKTGNTSYARPGVRASIYFNKQMFVGEPPNEILLDCDNLAVPGETKPGTMNSAEKAAKAQARAVKAQARAAKALAAAHKAQERAAKYAVKPAAEAVPAQPEGAPVEV